MIYVTGDTHGERERFLGGNIAGERNWTDKDCLIICGDFGYLFKDEEKENLFLDYLAEKPYTICFCDGNHENFDRIEKYPQEVWNGGNVHRIRENIYHLMRGQVFCIDGKSIFTMGGAYSIDKTMRKEGYSWWQQELPTNEEYHTATKNLEKCKKEVDYIITHTAPREIIRKMGYYPHRKDMELTGFLEWIMYEVKFKKWFFGHWHQNIVVDEKFRGLLKDVVRIDE